MDLRPLELDRHRCVVVLTGAGVSVASGLRPYRGAGGLWTERPDQIAVATADTLARDPAAITQNVDGLHQRAGSRAVVEIHGTLARSRCSVCDRTPFADGATHAGDVPGCDRCGAPLRPDVVLFGEYPSVDDEHRAKRALRECDLFLAIGTSGTVAPASSYVRWAEVNGARTIFVSAEPMSPPNPAFREMAIGRAEELVPRLLG